ncbi:GntR family transcriptional regulator [Brooklawnia cerclae]|nr:GntR family transcriptional regulator [Brooklawnia cerclae]
MDFDASVPIWLQLVAEFRRRIAAGEWAQDSRIAGVRELAVDLGVNPNTVQRALAELERDGLCRSERTSGRFVTADPALIDDLRRDMAAQAADAFVHAGRGVGLTLAQAQNLLEERWTSA